VTVSPSVHAMVSVAVALGQWRDRVVFIGGAVAPLLQTDPPFPRVRPTDDVDAVAATTSYTDSAELDAALRDLGFKHGGLAGGAEPTNHAHRWYAPDGTPFDLVPQGQHLGASGNKWDVVAVRTAVSTTIEGVAIRHVSAPGFLVLKWAAYADRGHTNPMASADLEDILALLASRPTILDEIAGMPEDIRAYLRDSAAALIAHPDYADALDAHLNNAVQRIEVIRAVRRVLERVAALQ
jgi:predicted nucleotidyltransferase